jgi:hypothetical protein
VIPLLALFLLASKSSGGAAAKQPARPRQTAAPSRGSSTIQSIEHGVKAAEGVASALSDIFGAL